MEESMDLIGLDMKARQAREKFTVVTKLGDAVWTPAEINRLVHQYRTIISTLPRMPSVAILAGEYSKDQLVAFLGTDNFTVELMVGRQNPKLPFSAPML